MTRGVQIIMKLSEKHTVPTDPMKRLIGGTKKNETK